jgi:hypothetical protein
LITGDFDAAMSPQDFIEGEARHKEAEESRMFALTIGLTKSSEELEQAYRDDRELYLVALKEAIEAYENCKNIEELLIGSLARLVSVVEESDDVTDRIMEIVRQGSTS